MLPEPILNKPAGNTSSRRQKAAYAGAGPVTMATFFASTSICNSRLVVSGESIGPCHTPISASCARNRHADTPADVARLVDMHGQAFGSTQANPVRGLLRSRTSPLAVGRHPLKMGLRARISAMQGDVFDAPPSPIATRPPWVTCAWRVDCVAIQLVTGMLPPLPACLPFAQAATWPGVTRYSAIAAKWTLIESNPSPMENRLVLRAEPAATALCH